MTLEIVRPEIANYPAPAEQFMWQHLLRDVVQGDRETVRVVPESEGVSWKQVCEEGERVSREEGYKILIGEIKELNSQRDSLAARVETLEIALKQAALESSAEPVAFAWQHEASEGILALEHMLYVFKEDERPMVRHRLEKLRRLVEVYRDHVVPLFSAPPQPRGWLTEEEREAIAFAADQPPESDFVTISEGELARTVLTALLARNSPPEVVLPDYLRFQFHGQVNRDVRAALSAAGVEVKPQS